MQFKEGCWKTGNFIARHGTTTYALEIEVISVSLISFIILPSDEKEAASKYVSTKNEKCFVNISTIITVTVPWQNIIPFKN